MSMREKIARAIHAKTLGEWDMLDPIYQAAYREQADAVLDALMEPTEGMQEMGDYAYNLTGISGASGFPATSEEHTTFIFEAMIQAAKEGK